MWSNRHNNASGKEFHYSVNHINIGASSQEIIQRYNNEGRELGINYCATFLNFEARLYSSLAATMIKHANNNSENVMAESFAVGDSKLIKIEYEKWLLFSYNQHKHNQ